ncbi:MAG: hypothetical protein ACI8QT_000861 [Halioglobus sp.]
MSYNIAKCTPYLTRTGLVAVLLFAQAFYAGHAMAHGDGNQLDCQLCLQTSTDTAALPYTEMTMSFSCPFLPTLFNQDTTVRVISAFPKSHPSRAPPFFSI